MVEIEDMTDEEARELLARLNYGHLGCSMNNEPYVVPIHYAYDGEHVFIYTTEGKKTDILGSNPEICLQAEDVDSNESWKSVMAFGSVSRLTDEGHRQTALDIILKVNPKLTPAVSVRWMDSWVRANIEAIYRFRPRRVTGRQTVSRNLPPTGRPRAA